MIEYVPRTNFGIVGEEIRPSGFSNRKIAAYCPTFIVENGVSCKACKGLVPLFPTHPTLPLKF
jgi:hypothetical protein